MAGFDRDFLAKTPSSQRVLTADFRRFSQIRIRIFHRRDAEKIPFPQSGDGDWAKSYSSNLSNVFVCCRLPTNKNLILCALCGNIPKGISICVNLRESAVNFRALFASLRESSLIRFGNPKFNRKFKYF